MKFPDSPMFTGVNAPCRAEVEVFDLEVEGAVPEQIAGTFYRVQPDFIYPPRYDNDVPFNGDGHVTMFRFSSGHVDMRSRYVRTQRYEAQRNARRALFGTYRNRATDEPEVRGLSAGTANTNLIFHAGRLFALKEDSPPVLMDPDTLETLDNQYDFDGRLGSRTFTAHPKVDPVTGEMVAFGYEASGDGSDDLAVYSMDASGRVTWEAWIKVPYVGMVHDFALTQTHIAFLVIPLAYNKEQMRRGGVHFAWDSTLPSWLGVMRRGGDGSDLRWFRGPERCATHVMNAFSDGDRVYVDMDMAESNQFPFFPHARGAFDPQRAQGRMTRLSVDLGATSAESYGMEILHPQVGVLPRTDERYWSLPYRIGFMPVTNPELPRDAQLVGNTGLVLNTWTRFDHASRRTVSYSADAVTSLQEPCFVPRSADAPEGSGWLVGLANRHDQNRTDLLVIDAEHPDEGPVAVVRLPVRLRNGVHGTWVPAEARLRP